MSTRGVISPTSRHLVRCVLYIPSRRGLSVLFIQICRQPRSRVRDKSIQHLRFFMDFLGNKSLLDRRLVAFFASRTSPPEALHLAQQWAREISLSDNVIISGFHSPIEREVLNILLSRNASVIVALGRTLYHTIPAHLHSPLNDTRLLFISFRNHRQPSLSNSQLRNWAVAELASEVVFAPFDDSSQLSTLYFSLRLGSTPCSKLGCLDI